MERLNEMSTQYEIFRPSSTSNIFPTMFLPIQLKLQNEHLRVAWTSENRWALYNLLTPNQACLTFNIDCIQVLLLKNSSILLIIFFLKLLIASFVFVSNHITCRTICAINWLHISGTTSSQLVKIPSRGSLIILNLCNFEFRIPPAVEHYLLYN